MATFDATQPWSPSSYSASETLVLLLDFHSMFIDFAGDIAQSAAAKATQLRQWAHSQNIAIAHCLIGPNLPIAPLSKDPQRTSTFITKMQSSPESIPEPTDIHCSDSSERVFLRAPGYVSAQKSPGLSEFLVEKGYKSLILAGLSTSGCVLRTAIAATEADYVVTVVEDACANPGEGVHEMMVRSVLPMRAHVCDLETLKGTWEGKAK